MIHATTLGGTRVRRTKEGGQYGLFYNGAPYGSALVESAWIYGLQQNEENHSNLALVNTGEIDDTDSAFNLDIYDGDTGLLVQRLRRQFSLISN